MVAPPIASREGPASVVRPWTGLNDYYDPRPENSHDWPILPRRSAISVFVHGRSRGPACDARAVCGGIGFPAVIHLAAQAGVRHSIDHPPCLCGMRISRASSTCWKACRRHECRHLVYASSVVGFTAPQCEAAVFGSMTGPIHPVSLYAATKRANELMGLVLQPSLPAAGQRACDFFFTIYGAVGGGPNMAIFLFARGDRRRQARSSSLNHGKDAP